MSTFSLATPIFRIFDEDKAKEFYVGWLGLTVDWEHRFEENLPLYMQVSRGDFVLHLSEHHSDASPGARARVRVGDLDEFHKEITAKRYGYGRTGLETMEWGERCVTVIDPFSN